MRERTVGASNRPARTEARRLGAPPVATPDEGDIEGEDDAADVDDETDLDDAGDEEEDEPAADDDENFDDAGDEDEDDELAADDEENLDDVGDEDEDDEWAADGDENLDDAGDEDEDDGDLDPYRFLLQEDDKAPNLEAKPPNLLAGRIEILDKLAEGAMGVVWRGRHHWCPTRGGRGCERR